MSEYDNNALLEDVRERGRLPADDLDYTSAKLLTAATREMRDGVAPLLVESRAEHLVYEYEVAALAGTATYRMPPRAVGGALRDVVWMDSSGNAAPPLRQISSDDPLALNPGDGTPSAYYTRNYTVVLVPTPSSTGTVRMPYYARPNRLVLVAEDPTAGGAAVSTTSSYNSVTDTLIVYAEDPPTALQPANTAVAVDLVRATPGFETLYSATEAQVFVQEPTPGIWAYTITGVTENPGITVGDYICLAGEAPVPQLPVELHGLLAARTARRVLKAVGDDTAWQSLDADVQELEAKARSILSPRVAGDTQQAGGSIGSSGLVAGLRY